VLFDDPRQILDRERLAQNAGIALQHRIDWWAVGLTVAGSGGSIALNVWGVGQAAAIDYVVAAIPPTAALLAFGALMRQIHQFYRETEVEAEAATPEQRPLHTICAGHDGTLFLRRPKPVKVAAPTQPAGTVGTRVSDVQQLLSGPHAPVVYFVTNGDRVKIGTTTHLRARIRRLCLRVEDIALVLHGTDEFERSLHERFTAHRVGNTEWFELTGQLAAFVAAGGADEDDPLHDVVEEAMRTVAQDADVELLTVTDVASLKGVAEGTVRSWVNRNKLVPAQRDADGRLRFHPAAVAEID
jgi:hypothetical protein